MKPIKPLAYLFVRSAMVKYPGLSDLHNIRIFRKSKIVMPIAFFVFWRSLSLAYRWPLLPSGLWCTSFCACTCHMSLTCAPSLLFLDICVGVWCVHHFICVHIYTQLHVHVETRGWFTASSLTTLQFALLYFTLLRWDLSLFLELIHSVRLTAQWSWWSCLHLPTQNTVVTDTCLCALFFCHDGDLNSCLHYLLTKASPQPLSPLFIRTMVTRFGPHSSDLF